MKMEAIMQKFIEEKLNGLKLDECWDVHAHLLGIGDSNNSGIYLKRSTGIKKLAENLRLSIFKHYTKSVKSPTDDTYLNYFIHCAENSFPGFKSCAFAFTSYHDNNGVPNDKLSDFVIPNEWSKYASQKSKSLLYVASVHPKENNAIEKLIQAKNDGAIAIKWLPCAHNINPSDESNIPFYKKLVELKLPLITHAGSEHAVHGEHFNQNYGNPLLLRLPLNYGVKVIVAHCATDGYDYDFEESHKTVSSFELFARLMDDPKYNDCIYADISATPQINRAKWLPILLERQDWHHKLLNGSDYPLPAIPILFSLRWLKIKGLLTEKDVWSLVKVKKNNPLLFDFLLKRSLCYKGKKFSNQVFETKRIFDFNNGVYSEYF